MHVATGLLNWATVSSLVGSLTFLFASNFSKYLNEKYKTSHITVREYVFQEAERQLFGLISIFLSPAIWALLLANLPNVCVCACVLCVCVCALCVCD